MMSSDVVVGSILGFTDWVCAVIFAVVVITIAGSVVPVFLFSVNGTVEGEGSLVDSFISSVVISPGASDPVTSREAAVEVRVSVTLEAEVTTSFVSPVPVEAVVVQLFFCKGRKSQIKKCISWNNIIIIFIFSKI